MTSKIECSQYPQSASLLDGVKLTKELLGYNKWKITKENLLTQTIIIESAKTAVKLFKQQATNVDPEFQEDFSKNVEKAEKKLRSAEETIEHLLSSSEETDPRVKKFSSKVNALNVDTPKLSKKIKKCIDRLIELDPNKYNERTQNELRSLLGTLNKLNNIAHPEGEHNVTTCNIQTLGVGKPLIIFERRLANNISQINFNLNDFNSFKTTNISSYSNFISEIRQQISLNFLHTTLISADSQWGDKATLLFLTHPDCIGKIIGDGHLESLQNQNPSTASLLELRNNKNFQSFSMCLSDPTPEQLTHFFEAVMEIKQMTGLSRIATVIQFGSQHLTLTIDSDNTFYLFDQYGKDGTCRNPYVAFYKEPKEIAQSLHLILNPQNQEEDLVRYRDILPYVDQDSFTMTRKYMGHEISAATPLSPLESREDRVNVSFNIVCSAKEFAPQSVHRSEQRAKVETLLFQLSSCLSLNGDIAPLLASLEALKFDSEDLPKDLPKDTKDFACALFGKLYLIYLAAWENQTMIHPHDPCFHSDFGRNAFVGEAKDLVPATYKILALQDLIKSVQDTWKV